MSLTLISTHGRYKYTGVYANVEGPVYGPWMPPGQFEDATPGQGNMHVVSAADVGFPDRIAAKYYGQGMEMFWFAVCRVNGIVDVETDLYPGRRIYIPSLARITGYLRSAR